MKKLFTILSLAASLAACATPHAPREFDFSELNLRPGVALGTVESVHTVRIERDIHAFEQALELRMKPDLGERLVIHLDAGSAVTVTVKGAQRFAAGQRVRVVTYMYGPYGPRVEHE
jgi:outer membrane lipoprotein SlyB